MMEEMKFNKQIKIAVIVFAVIEAVVIVGVLIYRARS
jgi:hypothetical protein